MASGSAGGQSFALIASGTGGRNVVDDVITRVVVGVSGSLGSLQALRRAGWEAG